MKQIILGTAGHIDHGKTSLIKALTGVDTDRLKEEKERGITIELGFAALDLPGGQHVGIVDVPGHEKFVKNMVAGATGIDIVILVIAADEGVMPQTREHMEICTLLGIRHGFVALTKIDMVDEEWLELAREDVSEFTRDTFLEDQPVIPVSSLTGDGLDNFNRTLEQLCGAIPERKTTGLFRLPVDRVFTIRGFGTVITGSLVSGKIAVGENIELYPAGIRAKVRGLQVHSANVSEALAGQRTAVNFQGLDKSDVLRGFVLARPGTLKPSYMVDIAFNYLNSCAKPLKNRTRVRFHTGTSEIMGNIILIDREALDPGQATVAQIRLDTPVVLVKDDRYVIRSYSPVRTIGGGRVLNPVPPKHKRFRAEVIESLSHVQKMAPEEIIAFHARQSGFQGTLFSDLRLVTNLPDKKLESAVNALLSNRRLITVDRDARRYIHADAYETLRRQVLDHLSRYHNANPLKAGMPSEELKSKFPGRINPKLPNQVLNHMIRAEELILEDNLIRLAGHQVNLGVDQAQLKEKIRKAYVQGGITPPYFKEICQELATEPKQAQDVLRLMVENGILVKVKEDLYFHGPAIENLKGRLVAFLKENGAITTPQFKDMTGASRKYVIPLAEFFDATKVTIRVGDSRQLRKG
ncbi:MAG: selenocysteine-specific translation elongation factor [Desulfosarcina sp.]|nr:selenocysteine-specific translation elongation factor [Desulfobacterales bacterium]